MRLCDLKPHSFNLHGKQNPHKTQKLMPGIWIPLEIAKPSVLCGWHAPGESTQNSSIATFIAFHLPAGNSMWTLSHTVFEYILPTFFVQHTLDQSSHTLHFRVFLHYSNLVCLPCPVNEQYKFSLRICVTNPSAVWTWQQAAETQE